ncbi:hypothetical protein KM043_008481 [Ampulex compressa]|nr:hypothetical protein KM043_008481 [Ampulex compressa]
MRFLNFVLGSIVGADGYAGVFELVSPKFARASALHGTLHHHSATASPCSSRAASRSASACDLSSGYESTRSHLGPHYSGCDMPRNNSPVLKYNTLKPRRRKHKQSQFYSLRLCRRHENARRKYELYAIPIYKGCPHKSGSTSTITTIVRSVHEEEPLASRSSTMATTSTTSTTTNAASSPMPPIPAPRPSRLSDPSKHTYQNVPPPVFPPKNASFSRIQTDSLHNYKEHYQQQQRQEMQQYSYPLPSNSSSQLTLPLTRSLYHSSIVSPLQTSFVHTNNRPSTLAHQEAAVRRDEDLQQHQHQQQQQQSYVSQESSRQSSRRHASGRRNERNRKYRKHERTERKQKQRRSEPRKQEAFTPPACETSFHQVQEVGIPETYKISYPHYYEDDIAECPTEYRRANPGPRQQLWERQSNRGPAGKNGHYADPAEAKGRGKTKRASAGLVDGRSPSAPTIMQYAELHFRDVGQEIDV